MSESIVTLRLTRAQANILMAIFTDRLDAIHRPVALSSPHCRVIQECVRQTKAQVPAKVLELP